jgi:hypothetical protein
MPSPAKFLQPVHSEDFDGQTGADLGRDIWGVRDNGEGRGETVCIQCVNRSRLTLAKAEADLAKVLKAGNGRPQRFRIVTRSAVSATMRSKIKAHALAMDVQQCDIWSGAEFEEFLRRDAESLLKRFVEGETFPDAAPDLRTFALADCGMSDEDALALMAKLFDRPAFYTPIHAESNLGDFKQAITDTIQALGTGIWKARDGQVIARIPSRQQLQDEGLRRKVQAVEKALAKLRARFDELVRDGVVRHCGCNEPTCPVYFMPSSAAHELELLRRDALRLFRTANERFEEPSW